MKIRINAKSTPELVQFKSRLDAGFNNFEIQLIKKYVLENEYQETKEAIEKYGADISVVHTPLISEPDGYGFEISLIHLLRKEYKGILEDTCKYAQFISEIENKRIKIVIHNDNSKQAFEYTGLIENKIGPFLKELLDKYYNVDFVVESSSVLGDLRFKSIFKMDDVAYVVSKLNNICANRFYVVIDTCHEMMNNEAWKRFTYQELFDWNDEFKDSFNYGSKLGLIHLNNIWDNGVDEDHGRPFDIKHEGDLDKLKRIMNAYDRYANCEITIEVKEDDYLDTPYNLIKTKEALETIGYKDLKI